MTLEQLRLFVAVAERGHVTAAARALNLTQSAVSNAIAALEQRHAARLFDRVGRGIVLNEVGRAFLPEAKAVLARAEAAEAVLADLSALRHGRLSVFASQTIAGYWLPARLVRFRQAYPAIELSVAVGNTEEAAAAVLDGRVELGFIEGEIDEPRLAIETVGSDRLIVLVPPDHSWAGRQQLSLDDLTAAPWVLREHGSGTRSSFESAVGGGLTVSLSLPTNEAVLAAAVAGAGPTVLSEHVAAAAIAAGRLVRVPFDLGERPFRLIRHKERHRTRAAGAFTALLAG